MQQSEKRMADKEDIFKQARESAIAKQLEESIANKPALDKKELLPVVRERLEDGETQWDLLRKMIDGSLTERFIEVLGAMPDRDFARNYLKLLEHFKPKITRSEGGEQEIDDLTVNIQMVVVNEKGEKEIITVNDANKTKNLEK